MTARLTPRNAAIVGAAVVLLVIVVGWFLLVSPQRSKASKLGGQITAAETQLTLALAEARTLRREQHSRTAQLAALTRALPPDIRMSEILHPPRSGGHHRLEAACVRTPLQGRRHPVHRRRRRADPGVDDDRHVHLRGGGRAGREQHGRGAELRIRHGVVQRTGDRAVIGGL